MDVTNHITARNLKKSNHGSVMQAPIPLSACHKGTFAYRTVKDRMPVILTKVIDYLSRCRDGIVSSLREEDKEAGQQELKNTIAQLSQLRWEMATNKPILSIESPESDAETWNRILETTRLSSSEIRWFDSPWLLVECFMYRKIREAFETCKVLQNLDPWFDQKKAALHEAIGTIQIVSKHLNQIDGEKEIGERQKLFREFLELSLWANRHDLSISAGELQKHHADPVGKLVELRRNLIVDDVAAVWERVSNVPGGTIAIVLDNCGFELASDLLLADFLLRSKLADHVDIYLKKIPWFVSDVTAPDFTHTLEALSQVLDLAPLVSQWQEYLNSKKWAVLERDFFTLPCDYSQQKDVDCDLYEELGKCKLIVLKGDLNYRKLVGDLNWDFLASFESALRGFHPAPLVALRTLKAEVVVGLKDGVAKRCTEENPDWLVSGEYGVIQYCDKVE